METAAAQTTDLASYHLLGETKPTVEDKPHISIAQDSYIFSNNIPTPKKPEYRSYSKTVKCSCVLYARLITGLNESVGLAKNWPINSKYPTIGGVVVTSEGKVGHVAVIKDIKDGKLILDESNWVSCTITSGRELPIDSPLIRGYWDKENVLQ